MSKKNFWVQSVMAKLSQESLDDTQEGIKTEEVTASADAQIEIRRLKDAQETEVLISSLEHDLVEIEGLNDGVEELATAQEEIGELRAAMESFAEQGGMSKQTAQIASIALRQAANRVYMDVATPSLESFSGSTADRVDMTVLSVEEADGVLVKAWKAIKEFFKGIYERVVGWFKKIGAAVDKEKAKTEEAAKEAAQAEKDGKEASFKETSTEAEGIDKGVAKLAMFALLGAKVRRAVSGEFTVDRDKSLKLTKTFFDLYHKSVEAMVSLLEKPDDITLKAMVEAGNEVSANTWTKPYQEGTEALTEPLIGGGAYSAKLEGDKLTIEDDSIVEVLEVTEKDVTTRDVSNTLSEAVKIYDAVKAFGERNEKITARALAVIDKKESEFPDTADKQALSEVKEALRVLMTALSSPAILRLSTRYMSAVATYRNLIVYK